MSDRKIRFREKVLRALTLACFFHFSGLNNGFGMMIVSSGQLRPVDFTPVAARAVVASLHPLRWKKALLDPVRFRLFPRSAKVIERASQRAVQYMLMESSYVQMWLADSAFVSAPDQTLPGKRAMLTARTKRAAGKALRMGMIQRPVLAQNGLPGAAFSSSLLARGSPECRVAPPERYLQADRKQLWFKDRHDLWKDAKREGNIRDNLAVPWMAAFGERGKVDPQIRRRIKKFVKFRDPLKRRAYASSVSEDDPSRKFSGRTDKPCFQAKAGFLISNLPPPPVCGGQGWGNL